MKRYGSKLEVKQPGNLTPASSGLQVSYQLTPTECFLNLSKFHCEMQTTKKFKWPPSDLRKGFLSLLFISLECNCKVEDSHSNWDDTSAFCTTSSYISIFRLHSIPQRSSKPLGVELTAHQSGRKD